MANDEPISLKLELDATADPIRGLLEALDGRKHEFVGWLGLAGAIEEALTLCVHDQEDGATPGAGEAGSP